MARGDSTEHMDGGAQEEHARWQQKCEEELDKIRTEGDLALIKAHAERQSIAKADEELQLLKKQLKEKKKQFHALSKTAAGAGGASGAVVSPTPIAAADGYAGENHGDTVAASSANAQRLTQMEERLKAAVSERTVELAKLRQQIDETRRQRLEGLQNEKRIADEAKHTEEAIQHAHAEVDSLKERAATLKNEIAQLQSDFDIDAQKFRIEKQRLTLEVDRITKPDKGMVKVNLPGRKSVYNSIGHRAKRGHLSKAKKMSMEQKVVSFEQKKLLLDRLVDETGIQDLGEFVERYNEQERIKADILARIEAKSNTNSALSEAIAQLAEDITRLSGAGDIQTIVHMEQPSGSACEMEWCAPVLFVLELKRLIDADETQIKQWSYESQVYAETLKTFRDPIRDLYLELFPQDRDDEVSDSTINELSMLRRIGAIEERTMQRVLIKIHHEMETQQSSATWKRLRKYQGLQWKECEEEREGATSRSNELHVIPPSIRDAILHDREDDETDDEQVDDNVVVVHSDEFRHKQNGTNKAASHTNASSSSAAAASAATTRVQRKHAAISL